MNCKHCDAQIPEDSLFCPVCGKELEKEEVSVEVTEETAPEAVAEETAAPDVAVEETAPAEKAVVDGTECATVKSSKGFWISGSLLLGFQILISSRSMDIGYQPFVGVTNWYVLLYDLVYFLSSNFLGVIGFILLIIASIRTFGAKNSAAPEAAAEETPAEKAAAPAKANTKKITVAVIALVLLAAVLIGLIAGSMGGKSAAEPTVPATEAAEPVVIPADGDPASPQCKASYTVSDEEAIAAADVVVATMGDKTLTNGELQAFYWQELYMFLNEYGYYASSLGLDLTQPLDKQAMMASEPVISWQQFFLDGAVSTWKTYQALGLEAEENGYQMPADIQAEYDKISAEMEAGATSGGFESTDAMIRENVGAACTLDSYLKYVWTDYYGRSYYYDFCDNLNPSDAEVEAFFAENEAYFEESGITKDAKFVNVRHVLLQPAYSEIGDDGYPVFTDEAWEACRAEVDEIYNKWQEGDKSEESFAQLAMDNSVDGSAANGGLYEDVYVGQMVQEFEDWCFDESRRPGDHGLVKTQYGYHIMFFSAHRSWFDIAKDGLIDDLAYDKIPDTMDKYPADVDFSLVALGQLNFA